MSISVYSASSSIASQNNCAWSVCAALAWDKLFSLKWGGVVESPQ